MSGSAWIYWAHPKRGIQQAHRAKVKFAVLPRFIIAHTLNEEMELTAMSVQSRHSLAGYIGGKISRVTDLKTSSAVICNLRSRALSCWGSHPRSMCRRHQQSRAACTIQSPRLIASGWPLLS